MSLSGAFSVACDVRGAPDAAHTQRGCLATSTGIVLCCVVGLSSRAGPLLRMYLFGTAKGRHGPRGISKIVKRVPIVLCP